jgi:hypothetical protein
MPPAIPHEDTIRVHFMSDSFVLLLPLMPSLTLYIRLISRKKWYTYSSYKKKITCSLFSGRKGIIRNQFSGRLFDRLKNKPMLILTCSKFMLEFVRFFAATT